MAIVSLKVTAAKDKRDSSWAVSLECNASQWADSWTGSQASLKTCYLMGMEAALLKLSGRQRDVEISIQDPEFLEELSSGKLPKLAIASSVKELLSQHRVFWVVWPETEYRDPMLENDSTIEEENTTEEDDAPIRDTGIDTGAGVNPDPTGDGGSEDAERAADPSAAIDSESVPAPGGSD